MLLVYEILPFLLQFTSRRKGNCDLSRPGLWEVLRAVFPDLEVEDIPRMDTVNRLLERIPPESRAVPSSSYVKPISAGGSSPTVSAPFRLPIAVVAVQPRAHATPIRRAKELPNPTRSARSCFSTANLRAHLTAG